MFIKGTINKMSTVKLSKKSWLYQVISFFELEKERNLCNLFWKLISHIALSIVIACVLLSFLTVGIVYMIDPFVTLITQAYLGFPLYTTFAGYFWNTSIISSVAIGTVAWWNFTIGYVFWIVSLLVFYNVWFEKFLTNKIEAIKQNLHNYNSNVSNYVSSPSKVKQFIATSMLKLSEVVLNVFALVFDLGQMFVAFVKGKKEKYCPLVEYEDN